MLAHAFRRDTLPIDTQPRKSSWRVGPSMAKPLQRPLVSKVSHGDLRLDLALGDRTAPASTEEICGDPGNSLDFYTSGIGTE